MATKTIQRDESKTTIEIVTEESKYIKRVKLRNDVNEINKTFTEQLYIEAPSFSLYEIGGISYAVDENDSRALEFSKCMNVQELTVVVNSTSLNINVLIEERDIDVQN